MHVGGEKMVGSGRSSIYFDYDTRIPNLFKQRIRTRGESDVI